MTPERRGIHARQTLGRETGIATEYLVILILVGLGAVLLFANYGRNVGNRVGAAGDKIGTLGEGRGVASSGGAEPAPSSGESGPGAASSASVEPSSGGPSARRPDQGRGTLPESASSGSTPSASVGGPSGRQVAIGGIILVTIGLLVAVRLSQVVRRASEQRVKQARKAIREEENRDLDEDTLNVKRREIFGEEDPEKLNR